MRIPTGPLIDVGIIVSLLLFIRSSFLIHASGATVPMVLKAPISLDEPIARAPVLLLLFERFQPHLFDDFDRLLLYRPACCRSLAGRSLSLLLLMHYAKS